MLTMPIPMGRLRCFGIGGGFARRSPMPEERYVPNPVGVAATTPHKCTCRRTRSGLDPQEAGISGIGLAPLPLMPAVLLSTSMRRSSTRS